MGPGLISNFKEIRLGALQDFEERSIKRKEMAKNRGKDKLKLAFTVAEANPHTRIAQKASFVAFFIGLSLKSYNRDVVFRNSSINK
jgi:hypothetical protein